jgi:hypothetical protein
MTARWGIVETLSLLLPAREREVVRGDIAEAGENVLEAVRDILGLAFRRQLEPWKALGPWLALAAIVVPYGIRLSNWSAYLAHISAIYSWLYLNNWTAAYVANPAERHDLIRYCAAFLWLDATIACASWSAGFLAGALSRGAFALNGVFFCCVCIAEACRRTANDGPIFSLALYSIIFPVLMEMLLVVVPSLWGMHRGLRFSRIFSESKI